jgi:hypothetical protein
LPAVQSSPRARATVKQFRLRSAAEDTMTQQSYVIDPSASRLIVRTRAVGTLARLAHDLEIRASSLRGGAEVDGDRWTARLEVPVVSLRIAGTLKGDKLDPGGVSASDRGEIERKIREEVLAGTTDVCVIAEGTTPEHAEVTVSLASGRSRVQTPLWPERHEPDVKVIGGVELSLKSLGVREVKGPLGVFRVKDIVEVFYELTLRPAR